MVKEKRFISRPTAYVWAVLRICLGLIFLWAFFDKLIGLGYATCHTDAGIQFLCKNAWLQGESPTTGFLTFATSGPLAPFFKSLAGYAFVDWIFMLGLLGIGLALTLGVLVDIASVSGAVMLFLMWAAVFPPENNPLLDDHLIYLVLMVSFILVHAGRRIGLGTWWRHHSFVKAHPWLE